MCGEIPDAFEMHRAYLHYIFLFFSFQDSIPTTAGHACYIQELGAIYHVVIYFTSLDAIGLVSVEKRGSTFSPCNTNPIHINLKTQASLLLKNACRKPRSHTRWLQLARSIHSMGSIALLYRQHTHRRQGRQLHALVMIIWRTLGMSIVYVWIVGGLRIWQLLGVLRVRLVIVGRAGASIRHGVGRVRRMHWCLGTRTTWWSVSVILFHDFLLRA